MCGVIGYIGDRACVDIVFQGLKKLEYRGYDSAGIAVLKDGEISTAKAKGKLKELKPYLNELAAGATVGIGHTRWATHGVPSVKNAHPHVIEKLGIVHNGIIENYKDLKAGLLAGGIQFQSDTDTEVILHLLYRELAEAPTTHAAILNLTTKLKGAFSLGIINPKEPNALYVVKQGSPLAIGVGEGENFFGSDAAALVEHTKKAIFLEDGEFARIEKDGYQIWDFKGKPVEREAEVLEWSAESLEKGGYAHYMLKEIHEQPTIIGNCIARYYDHDANHLNLENLGLNDIDLSRVQSINIVACGTAYYSGMMGKYFLEQATGLPVNVDLASEFRYRRPHVNENSLTIAVTQSGETMDTLEGIKYAKSKGSQIFCICNVPYSSISREADGVLLMECGPEIGVASTKAFTAMVLCQYFVSLAIGEKKGLKLEDRETVVEGLKCLRAQMEAVIATEPKIKIVAEKYHMAHNFIFTGRGEHYPIALEGALKLKEISYVHAEGYASGELKHGPIALVDKDMPVFALAPQDFYYEKTLSNIEQIAARHGRVIGLAVEGDEKISQLCDDVVWVPHSPIPALQSILSVVPLQLFSYYVALLRGTDVDQPRNLAKSVTVE